MPRDMRDANRLHDRREKLKEAEQEYLRKKGWERTCDTPGSIWLWTRGYKGRTIMADQSTALFMQEHFDSGVYTPDED